MYDILFISYGEPNADKNWELLKSRYPAAKRVDGVKGIHQAHIKAAKRCFTKMFWVVDADAQLLDSFSFDYEVDEYNLETVHVWRSKNPVNDLVYGYGGIKLLPKKLALKMNTSKLDMTTSISNSFKAIEETSNITAFNTDPFSAWRSGFRECAKLSSRTIDRQHNSQTLERLETWCNQGVNRPFGIDAIKGAKEGRRFGEENKNNPGELQKINNFEWLLKKFHAKC